VRRPVQWLLVVVLIWLPLGAWGAKSADQPPKTDRPVQFTVSAPQAKSVAVAGSFNNWSPTANPMRATGVDGKWSASIPLQAGEHKFMYVVDGKTWLTPPVADEFVDDGFGQTNGVIVVR
jgi:1,4-alpha-glucan branching enzyme